MEQGQFKQILDHLEVNHIMLVTILTLLCEIKSKVNNEDVETVIKDVQKKLLDGLTVLHHNFEQQRESFQNGLYLHGRSYLFLLLAITTNKCSFCLKN